MRTIVNEIKRQFVGEPCYLDGTMAKVVGAKLDFAHVVTLDGKRDVEFSWFAVNRIMRRDRYFETY